MTEYKHIKRWTMPKYYAGKIWPDYYSSGVGQSRDSSALDRANFDAMWKRISALPEMDGDGESSRRIVREGHWAVGWVEWIAIHESDTAALDLADSIMGKMEDYPVIDEELWSEYENEECRETWENCYDPTERVDYFRRHSYTCTAMADLFAAIRGGDWGAAASMLHCPSDLIA